VMDYTKWWQGANMDVVNAGNQLGQYGVKGMIDAASYQVNLNPQGMAVSGMSDIAHSNLDPNKAAQWWQINNPKLKGLSDLTL